MNYTLKNIIYLLSYIQIKYINFCVFLVFRIGYLKMSIVMNIFCKLKIIYKLLYIIMEIELDPNAIFENKEGNEHCELLLPMCTNVQ